MNASRIAFAVALFVALPAFAGAKPEATFPTTETLNRAGALISSKRPGEARPLLEQAIAEAREAKDATGEGITLVMLGIVDAAEKKVDDARAHLSAAAERLRAGGDLYSAFLAHWTLGRLESVRGTLDASIVQHERAVSALGELSSLRTALNLDGLILLGPAIGIDTKALVSSADDPDVLRPFIVRIGEAMIHDSFGHVLIEAGDLARAEEELGKAAAAAEIFSGLFDAPIETHLGDLRRHQGRLDEAEEHYRKARESARPSTTSDRD